MFKEASRVLRHTGDFKENNNITLGTQTNKLSDKKLSEHLSVRIKTQPEHFTVQTLSIT